MAIMKINTYLNLGYLGTKERINIMAGTKNEKFDYVNDIWNIADYVRDTIARAEYNKLILPLVLLRRIECVLEPTRDAVCQAIKNHPELKKIPENLCYFSKHSFFNITNYRLGNLSTDHTDKSLKAYIDGFSENARSIFEQFDFLSIADRLQKKNMLYFVCQKFKEFDLSPKNVPDREMSNIYEHLIERYGDEISEDAEDFMTPKDIVRLSVSLLFTGDEEFLNSDTGIIRTLCDPTCGTGGFISDALDLLDEWHKDKKMKAPATIIPYGEELSQVTWAMAKANLMLRNMDNQSQDIITSMKDMSDHIYLENTLSNDMFKGKTFSYQLCNPPYGKKWEKEQDKVKEEAAKGFDGRFGAGTPKIDDGSMLFLQHVAKHLAPISEGGGKAIMVLSASPLTNGDAGSGESNIRRWLLEEDLIDCIIKLPEAEFFRTTINTYIWVLNNHKSENRKGFVQLIDASSMYSSLSKNQGKKRYFINKEQREWITKTYIEGLDYGNSKMIPAKDFMYREITTQRPLRMKISIPKNISETLIPESNAFKNLTVEQFKQILNILQEYVGDNQYEIANELSVKALQAVGKVKGLTEKALHTWIVKSFGVKCQSLPIIYDKHGNPIADSELKEFENVPMYMPIQEYMEKEVLPYAPDTWVDTSVTDDKYARGDSEIGIVGTKILFNKYFYKYENPESPDKIAAELLELENGLEQFMKELVK